jgi:hypothetical protein
MVDVERELKELQKTIIWLDGEYGKRHIKDAEGRRILAGQIEHAWSRLQVYLRAPPEAWIEWLSLWHQRLRERYKELTGRTLG